MGMSSVVKCLFRMRKTSGSIPDISTIIPIVFCNLKKHSKFKKNLAAKKG